VNNAIDKAIVPAADSAARGSGRWLTACGLLALCLERRLSLVLVPDERRKLFRTVEERPYLKRTSKGPVRIDLRRTRRELAAAIRRLRQIRAMVDSNPAVVGGEPTFRGTRNPATPRRVSALGGRYCGSHPFLGSILSICGEVGIAPSNQTPGEMGMKSVRYHNDSA
jgi:hypothetical protein